MYGQGCWEAQAGVEAPQGVGGNGVWRSGAVSTLRPKHSQAQTQPAPGEAGAWGLHRSSLPSVPVRRYVVVPEDTGVGTRCECH